MIRSKKEREAEKVAFKNMTWQQKIDHIFAYYKLPLFTAIVTVIVLVSTIITNVTRKNVVLYAGYANFSCGDILDKQLTEGYLDSCGIDTGKNEVLVYRNLIILENPTDAEHQYVYASKLKVLGAISAKQMDIMFMNKEAYDQMSWSGLLMDLDEVPFDDALRDRLQPYILSNEIVLEDNQIEYDLGEAEEYHATTEIKRNAIDISSLTIFRDAGIDNDLCIGIIGNSVHMEDDIRYISYLLDAGQEPN
jgi:hypothetical protein